MIRTVILGMGIRGNLFAQGLRQNPDATLVAVCDAKADATTTAAQRWGVSAYTDFGQMLHNEKPDAAIICTPDFAHGEPVLAAAARQVHILVEKPLATGEEEAARMRDAVQQAGIVCQVAFENRWNPAFVAVKQAVAQGELGDVLLFSGRLNDTVYVPTQMLSWAAKSTVGWFLLPHLMDLALWLSGKEPAQVYATASKRLLPTLGVDTYDAICTLLTFRDGTQAMFETGWVLPNSLPTIVDFKVEVVGDKGVMYVDCQDQMVHKSADRYTHPWTLTQDIHGTVRGFPLYMLDSFIAAVKDGTPPLATIEDGYRATRAIAAAHRSITTGLPVAL